MTKNVPGRPVTETGNANLLYRLEATIGLIALLSLLNIYLRRCARFFLLLVPTMLLFYSSISPQRFARFCGHETRRIQSRVNAP